MVMQRETSSNTASKSPDKNMESKETESKEKASKETESKEKASKETESREKASKEIESKERILPSAELENKEGFGLESKKVMKLVNSNSEKRRIDCRSYLKRNKKKCIIIIGGIVVLLVLVLATYFILENLLKGGSGPINFSPIICSKDTCKKAAHDIMKSSNFNVDPCTDFYEHVCGNYKGKMSLLFKRQEAMMTSNFDSLKKQNIDSAAFNKMKEVHENCMKSGGSSIKDVVRGEFAWCILNNPVNVDLTDVISIFLKVSSKSGIFALVEELPIEDPKTMKSRFNIFVKPSEYLTNLANNYTDLDKEFLDMANSISAAHSEMNITYAKDFKQTLVRIHEFLDDLTNFTVVNTDYFVKPVNDMIDWNRVSKAISPPNTDIYESMFSVVGFTEHLNYVIGRHSQETILDLTFFLWFRDTVYWLENETQESKKNACNNMIKENFPVALMYFYSLTNFDVNHQDEIIRISEVVRNSLIEAIMKTKWIDEKTKENAKLKVEKIKFHSAFDDLHSLGYQLEKPYKKLILGEHFKFYDTAQEVWRWKTSLIYELEKSLFEELRVQAKYNNVGNLVNVALGFMMFPMFHIELPIYMNYGGIGSVYGHEISHSIGPGNYLMDFYGRKTANWWSDSSKRNMQLNVECVLRYYKNNFSKVSQPLLDEIWSDVVGTRAAFEAMQKDAKNMKRNVQLPGFESKTNEQMFFYSYAANWCEDEEYGKKLRKTRVTGRARVNVALAMNEEFAKAFKCQKNSKMNPADRCEYYGD